MPDVVQIKICQFCSIAFKIADKIVIEDRTEHRYHAKCWGDGKGKQRPLFVGIFQEKDSKLSTVSRDRVSRRLKKLKRQVSKINSANASTKKFHYGKNSFI